MSYFPLQSIDYIDLKNNQILFMFDVPYKQHNTFYYHFILYSFFSVSLSIQAKYKR